MHRVPISAQQMWDLFVESMSRRGHGLKPLYTAPKDYMLPAKFPAQRNSFPKVVEKSVSGGRMSRLRVCILFLAVTIHCFGQAANGKLQIHHIDMGQGDAALLISPGGETVMFDAGEDIAQRKQCNVIVDYLDQAGIREIDYLFVSHYHSDHIGCIPAVLSRFPL